MLHSYRTRKWAIEKDCGGLIFVVLSLKTFTILLDHLLGTELASKLRE